MYGKCNHGADSSSSCKRLGFLQKNNSLEERSRIVSSLKERAAKNLLSCDNASGGGGGGGARFSRTETDFSNLFARGRLQKKLKANELYFDIKHAQGCFILDCKSNMQVMS